MNHLYSCSIISSGVSAVLLAASKTTVVADDPRAEALVYWMTMSLSVLASICVAILQHERNAVRTAVVAPDIIDIHLEVDPKDGQNAEQGAEQDDELPPEFSGTKQLDHVDGAERSA